MMCRSTNTCHLYWKRDACICKEQVKAQVCKVLGLVHFCYLILNIIIFICFCTYFFDIITLCINLPNMTLSNMLHLVYITLFGEVDGVTLSRLGVYVRKYHKF